jgi:hypothetical protein
MSEGFVALAARGDENRIAADDGLLRRFSGMRAKGTLPEDGLGILEITLNEELDFVVGGGEIDDGHLAAEAVKRVIAGGNDAAGSVQNKVALGIFFEAGEDFVEDGDLFGEVLGFALEVIRAVWPTHPGGDAVDAGETPSAKNGSESRFDLVVTADGRTAEGREIFCPVGFASAGHADESETKRLVRMRPHGELKSVKDGRWAREYKRRACALRSKRWKRFQG